MPASMRLGMRNRPPLWDRHTIPPGTILQSYSKENRDRRIYTCPHKFRVGECDYCVNGVEDETRETTGQSAGKNGRMEFPKRVVVRKWLKVVRSPRSTTFVRCAHNRENKSMVLQGCKEDVT